MNPLNPPYTVQMERGPELVTRILSYILADQIARALALAKPETCFLILDKDSVVVGGAFSRIGLPKPRF